VRQIKAQLRFTIDPAIISALKATDRLSWTWNVPSIIDYLLFEVRAGSGTRLRSRLTRTPRSMDESVRIETRIFIGEADLQEGLSGILSEVILWP
jgi:hypothetical protein